MKEEVEMYRSSVARLGLLFAFVAGCSLSPPPGNNAMVSACASVPEHTPPAPHLAPSLAPYGTLIHITGVFVEKGQSYAEQMLVREPFFFEVRAIAGRTLSAPLRIRYRLHQLQQANAVEFVPTAGRPYELEAYESLEEPPLGSPFLGPDDQRQAPGPGYFEHVLHVRPMPAPK